MITSCLGTVVWIEWVRASTSVPELLWKLRQNRDPISKHSEKSWKNCSFPKHSYVNFERSVLAAILATFHKTTSLSPPGRWTAARSLSWRVLPPRHSPCCLQHSHPSTPHASRPMLDPHHEPTTTAIISESSKKLTGKWWKQEQTQDNYCAITSHQVVNLRGHVDALAQCSTTRQPCISTSTYISSIYAYCATYCRYI